MWAAADFAAANHRHVRLCREVWAPWAAAGRHALESKAHAAFIEEMQSLGRRALRGWHRAARLEVESREEAVRRDDLFTKVGSTGLTALVFSAWNSNTMNRFQTCSNFALSIAMYCTPTPRLARGSKR